MANPHLVDELETAFQNCLTQLTTQEYFNANDPEETKNSVELNISKLTEVSRQLEAYFLQRRFLLSLNKPELIIKEDINDLKQELQRKEALITKHHEHLQQWQVLLSRPGGGAPGPSANTVPNAQPPQQGHPGQQQVGGHAQGHVQGQGMAGAGPGGQVQSMPPPSAQGNYPQGPLAYLEQTTSSIGMERR